MSSVSHIEDAALRNLYEDVWDEPYEVLTARAPEVLPTATDKLAVLEVMLEAVRVIIEDLDEHGEMNEALYDDNGYDHFEKEQQRLEAQIAKERAAGATSEVFSKWQNGDDDGSDALIDDIVDDVMGTKERKYVEALGASAEDDAEGFCAALDAINQLSNKGECKNFVSAYIQNALVAHFNAGMYDDGCDIVKSYANLIENGYPQGEYHWEAVASSVSIAQLAGDDETQGIVFDKLIPGDDDEIKHARLAFNLACLASLRGKKQDLLRFVKLAIQLGKTVDQFENDGDFDPFRDDPDFQALLK